MVFKKQPFRKCSIDGCSRVHFAKGFCNAHYCRLRTMGNIFPENPIGFYKMPKMCTTINCGRPHMGKGLCRRCYYRNIKQQVYELYGSKCVCCGEINKMFLSLDHVQNDGYRHRKLMGSQYRIYKDALNLKNYNRYVILCMNCNFGKRMNGGTCPHQMILKNNNDSEYYPKDKPILENIEKTC